MVKFRNLVRSSINLLISIFLVLTPVLGFVVPAHAETDPTGYAQSIAANGEQLDFYANECTSFVAWMLNHRSITYHGMHFTNKWGPTPAGPNHWGVAHEWDDYARALGFTVDHNPAVGAVAQWNANSGAGMPVGHVALVTSVNSDHTVNIQEYNWGSPGHQYGTRQNVNAEHYIHMERSLPGGFWEGSNPQSGILFGGVTLSASVQDNGNGGLDRAQISVSESSNGLNWTNWHSIKTQSFFGSQIGKVSTPYSIPAAYSCVRVSFDIFSNNRSDDNSQSRQLSPQGMKLYRTANVSNDFCHPPAPDKMFNGFDLPEQGGGGGGGSSSTGGCNPTATEVAFFENNDYQGACVVKSVGRYDNPSSLGMANDSVSSIKVGDLVKVRACNNDGNNSPCEEFSSNDTALFNNSIGDNTISSAEVTSRGGVLLCTEPNYGGTCKAFGNGEVDNLADFGLANNISSVKVSSSHTLFMFSGLDQSGTPSAWDSDRPNLAAHSWDNFARSIRVEPRYDTSCNQDPNLNGIMIYRDSEYAPGGGCMFITGNVADLGAFNFNKAVSLKFMGSYRFHYKATVYRDTNYGNPCASYTLDQSDLRECARIGASILVEPYTPPQQATNYAPAAMRDSGSTEAVVDDNLATQWVGGHKKPLGFVFNTFKEIKTVVIFDRAQSGSDNNQINKSKLVFSDGTVINNIEMTSGGPRCAEVNFPAKTVNWVNVVPDDASGNNGFREIQIWGVDGAVYANSNCVMKYNLTAAPGTGPAPTANLWSPTPPNAAVVSPANNTVLPANTTAVGLDYNSGDSFRVHVWGDDYDYLSDWSSAAHTDLTGLAQGAYHWQVQSKNPAGEGEWSAISTFTINTPPTVIGGSLTVEAATSQTVQVQAYDNDGSSLALSASGLPAFASFTDNGAGIGTLSLAPGSSVTGSFAVTVTASDGAATGSGVIAVTVDTPAAPPDSYQAEYFNNLTLSGTPALTRSEATVDNDWGEASPAAGVNTDNFSARWTKTATFDADNYKFSVTGDDGVRLFIDGVLAIDKWVDQGATTYIANKNMTAGSHTIVLEYYDSGGGAVAKLDYQKVTILPPAPGVTSGGVYKLVNVGSGKALDVDGGQVWNGTNVQIWSDYGNNAQRWQITQTDDGSYFLVNPSTGKALSVNGGSSADGTNVHIWEEDAEDNASKWAITQNGDGTYKLTNPLTGKVLDVNGGDTADGTNVQIWSDNGSAAQKWQIVNVAQANDYTVQYYGNEDLAGTPVWTTTERSIDHDWGEEGPNSRVPNDLFSATWTKTDTFAAGTYRFTAQGDDGFRLYIDGQPVILQWQEQGVTAYVAEKTLTAGAHQIVLQYFDAEWGAFMKLNYDVAPSGTNQATSGTAYKWWKNTSATSNSNRVSASALNDNNTLDAISLKGNTTTENANAWEGAGVVWSSNKTLNRFEFYGGGRDEDDDGVFTANVKLQFTQDGTTWTNATATISPSYEYDSWESSGQLYTFTFTSTSVRGVRVVGQVRTSGANSYMVYAREVRAY